MPELGRRTAGWTGLGNIPTKEYTCSYCGKDVATNLGWDGVSATIVVCHNCLHPTYFTEAGTQIPGLSPGRDIPNLPPTVSHAYREARDALAAGAPTASVLVARKLLMNIAVSKKAEEGKQFAYYVDYLAKEGYVPPGGVGWVGHIRDKGNEATHEIPEMSENDAAELINFLEMLLTFIYDFPNRVPSAQTSP
jgi:Domain of unknown function (DUF4145)